jgi:hypothetical protein
MHKPVPTLATALFLLAFVGGCDQAANGDDKPKSEGRKRDKDSDAKPAQKFKLGRITHKAISESSGIVASRKHPGVFWTHNDSGNGPFLFAITREGSLVAEYPVGSSARNNDWEAISTDDEGHLYIADIGNNDLKRDRILVYRVDEPDPSTAGKRGKGPTLKVNQVLRLKYPDKPFDAESFFVFKGRGYVISKQINGKNGSVYGFDLAAGGAEPAALQHVCDLPLRSPVTDAAISADGQRLAVMTVTGPNLFQINGDVAAAAKAQPASVTYFDFKDMNMEGVTFVEEGLLATTEEGQMLLFGNDQFGGK